MRVRYSVQFPALDSHNRRLFSLMSYLCIDLSKGDLFKCDAAGRHNST